MPDIIKPFEQPDQEPQAFPVGLVPLPGQVVVQQGMSLRDYFAAMTLTNGYFVGQYQDEDQDEGNYWREAMAREAYSIADHMLIARKRK